MLTSTADDRRNRRRIVGWVLIAAAVSLSYFLSYGLVIPVLEKLGADDVAYCLYSPAEILRNHSIVYWRITESVYRSFGGRTDPLLRRGRPQSLRKSYVFYDNGQPSTVITARQGTDVSSVDIVESRSFRQDGSLKSMTDDTGTAMVTKHFFSNGNLMAEERLQGIDLSGTQTWYDKNGNVVAECEIRDGRPWAGTIVKNAEQVIQSSSLDIAEFLFLEEGCPVAQ